MKEWSNDIVSFERNLRAIRSTGRPVAVLSSFTMSLLSSFVLGADGAISGMGSVAADLQAELFACVQRGDLEAAQARVTALAGAREDITRASYPERYDRAELEARRHSFTSPVASPVTSRRSICCR